MWLAPKKEITNEVTSVRLISKEAIKTGKISKKANTTTVTPIVVGMAATLTTKI